MAKITLSKMQDKVKKLILFWYTSSTKQKFVLSGYAGTGKTTIINECINELNLQKHQVSFCSFTGKAASVMNMKGLYATTIHKLIYKTLVEVKPVLNNKGRPVLNADGSPKTKKSMKHIKRTELPPMIKLIVVDEVSMVPKKLVKDLESFGVKILFIGDDAQLPSPSVENHILDNPDFTLTEIHRQALDNPIIWMSKLIREGNFIDKYGNLDGVDYGMYEGKVAIIRPEDVHEEMMTNADQIIVGKNDTRNEINREMRGILGYSGDYPNKGEKVICTYNNWDAEITVDSDFDMPLSLNLINGLIGTVGKDIRVKDDMRRLFRMDFKPTFVDKSFKHIPVDSRIFNKNNYNTSYSKRKRDEFMLKEGMINSFDYGYAITCHKSQGSEYDKVFIYYEHFWNMSDKWLYTAWTRAKKKLILVI